MRSPAPIAALALFLFLGGGGCSREGPRPPNILLFSIDSLNRSALSAFDSSAEPLTALGALAGESIRFLDAHSTASWTLPAHASLLTGLYPDRHGATDDSVCLAEDVETLAGALARHGYRTAASTGGGFLDEKYGLSRGFAAYRSWSGAKKTDVQPLSSVLEDARAFLASRSEDAAPFFLFLHTYGVHDYYRLSPRAVERLHGQEFPQRRVLAGCVLGEDEGPPGVWDQLRTLYRVELQAMDGLVGELVSELRARGLLDHTVIAVVSDHGEGFEPDRQRIHHGGRLHEDVIRIPFFLRVPGLGGRDEPAPVSLVDIMPTLIELAGLEPSLGLDGTSLVPLLRGERPEAERALFAMEHCYSWTEDGRLEAEAVNELPLSMAVIRGGTWYIRGEDGEEAFDMRADPRQVTDRLQELETAAGLRLLESQRRRPRQASPLRESDEELDAALEHLGYGR